MPNASLHRPIGLCRRLAHRLHEIYPESMPTCERKGSLEHKDALAATDADTELSYSQFCD